MLKSDRHGYTVVELMVTILIVSVLAVSLGALFVNLLTLQEREREEAFIRENLVAIAGNLADSISVGTFVSNRCDVTYRQEVGGVSLETGRVVRATQLQLRKLDDDSIDSQGDRLHVSVSAMKGGLHEFRGDDTPLIALNSMKELEIIDGKVDLSYSLVPLYTTTDGTVVDEKVGLWYLTIMAEYGIKTRNGKKKWKIRAAEWNGEGERENPVTVGRVVRLWNRE